MHNGYNTSHAYPPGSTYSYLPSKKSGVTAEQPHQQAYNKHAPTKIVDRNPIRQVDKGRKRLKRSPSSRDIGRLEQSVPDRQCNLLLAAPSHGAAFLFRGEKMSRAAW